ncbi:MAG: M6 family metalloprotease domain-containing protein [Muribaculaceae bacterium]|nr:M6 family metalloprotease domain-containing protein [Muribaculaceae bacterium]
MRKILTTALAVALTWVAASAVPAKPGQNRTVMQSDGTSITLHMVGDEWHHSWVTTDGKPVIEAANGDMVYRTATGASSVIAHEPGQRGLGEQSYLNINASQMSAKAIMAKSPRVKAGRENTARNMAKPAFAKSMPSVVTADGRRKAAGNAQVATVGSPRVPVLLVQYSDKSFSNTKAQIVEAYTSESTSKFSALRYFKDQSNGMFTPQFEFYGPYTLSGTRATYGANDSSGDDVGVATMVGEAIDKAGNDIDWTNYDNDNDNKADVVIVIYAGVGEAQASNTVPNSIWPMQWSLSSGAYYGDGTGTRTRNGVTIDAFGVFNEINGSSDSGTSLDGVGTYCHEFGHVMGLPDFYETTYKNDYYGMGYWDIMCSGSYNNNGYCPIGYNAYEKEFMGWHTPSTPVENHQYTLPKWNVGDDVSYKVTSPLNSNECYYLENRVKQGWDKYIEDEGMLVTHLTYVASRWTANSPNDQAVQLFTVIPADNKLSTSNENADCYGESNHELTNTSTPAAKLNMYASGSLASTTGGAGTMDQPLTDIYINSSDKSVSFWYMKGNTTPLDAPVLADASNVTTSGWTASWSAVTGAATYELQIDPASGGGSSTTGTVYTKVTDATTLSAGDKIIMVDETANKAAGSISSKVLQSVDVTISSSSIDLNGVTDVNVFTLEGNSSAWKLKQSDGTYLVSTTAKTMSSNSTGTSVTISISSGNATIDFGTAGKILYNNGSPRFTTYTSNPSTTMRLPQIYKLGGSSSSAPRRAGVTTKTITDITGTSYTVTGMADDQNYTFKVRAVPATTDTEHSTGDWSNVKTVKTVAADPEPLIVADETKSFTAFVGQSSTADVGIMYEDLSANITATITGDNASMFSCTSPITIDSSGDGEATLTVTYSPTAAGTHTATLTLNSTGADPVTCTLTGTATLAPLDTYNPVMQDATGVTTSAFTATWTDQTEAEAVASYTLQISKKPETTTTTVSDELTATTTGVTSTSYTAWTGKQGSSGAVYAGQSAKSSSNAIQMRATSPSGIVSTTSGGKIKKITVEWNSSTSGRTLDVYGSNTAYTSGSDLYDSTKQGTKLGSIASDSQTELTISGDYAYIGVRSNSGAMYLDKITFRWEKTTTVGSVQRRRAVSDTGNADSGVRTITGITSKSYEVTGLTAGVTYEYKVMAIYTDRADADESAWSNVKEVTLDDGPHTPTLAAEDLEFDGDYYVGDTYNKTLTVLGEYLSGDVTVTIGGDDAEMFSAPATIAASAFTNGEYALTVTYTPTTADVHSATLTLSSDGAEDVTVNLTGIADWQLFAPVMLVAQSVTSSSFKAVWTDETNASKVKSYTLWVNKTAGGDEPVASYEQLGDYSFANGLNNNWTKSSGYGAADSGTNSYRLGSGSQGCVLVGPSLNFTGYTKATVVINTKYYGSDNSSFTLSFGGATRTISTTSSFADYVEVFDISSLSDINGLAATITVSSSKRIYLANVTIYAGDASSALSAPRRVVATSGDADNGGLTVTGITDKFYTVEDLTAGATYEFKVKTVYSDDTESEWSNVEEVMLTESSDPRLSVDPLALAFTNVTTGATAQQTFTVTGTNLTGDVTVAVGEGMFTVSPTTISAADAADGATVTVTYAPTAFGNHTATVTLTSTGAEAVSVELSGSAVLEKAAPVMAEAADVNTTSFKAVWTDATPDANVTDYTLYVNKIADPSGGDPTSLTALLTENFSGVTATSDQNTRIDSSLDTYTDNSGWTGSYVYQAGGGGLKFGNSSNVGSLTTPSLDLSASGGKATVVVSAAYYGTDTSTKLKIQSGSNTAVTQSLSGTPTEYTVVIDCTAATGQTITFTGVGKRHYIYSVEVYAGDVSAQLSAAPRRATESGDADNGGLTVTGITDKEYTVTGLTPGATYEFYVEANYVDDTKSESDHEEVVLPAGTSLAEVLDSESGSYTISDNLVIVAVLNNMAYATNGTDWLPIKVESGDNFEVGDKITLLNGTFNGSATAPQFTLTECGESSATITYSIADFYLGQDWTGEGNASAVWERMPAAGEVAKFYGYYFLENGVPTLRGYSGTTGTKEKGRSLILLGDNYGTLDLTEGTLYKVEVCVQLAEAWSGAPRRIASGDADAYQNLRGQVISTEDLTQTGIDDIIAAGDVQSVRYINAAGQMSSEPFAGLNIVVTTLTDGTVRVAKVMK